MRTLLSGINLILAHAQCLSMPFALFSMHLRKKTARPAPIYGRTGVVALRGSK